MPVVRNESGQGPSSNPARYAPSSLARRQTVPVRLEATSASFCITLSERTASRSDCPLRLFGAEKPISSGLATLKNSGLPEFFSGFVIVHLVPLTRRTNHVGQELSSE